MALSSAGGETRALAMLATNWVPMSPRSSPICWLSPLLRAMALSSHGVTPLMAVTAARSTTICHQVLSPFVPQVELLRRSRAMALSLLGGLITVAPIAVLSAFNLPQESPKYSPQVALLRHSKMMVPLSLGGLPITAAVIALIPISSQVF